MHSQLLDDIVSRKFDNGHALRAAIEKDVEFKNSIKKLAFYYLNRRVEGCSNCIEDAYHALRRYKKMEKQEKSKYKVRAGAVIYDKVNLDAGKVMTQANITDELAEYHLLTNPSCRKFFVGLPEDIDAQLEEKYPEGWVSTDITMDSVEALNENKGKNEEPFLMFPEGTTEGISCVLADKIVLVQATQLPLPAGKYVSEQGGYFEIDATGSYTEIVEEPYVLTTADKKRVKEMKANIAQGAEPAFLLETLIKLDYTEVQAKAIIEAAQK